MKKLLLSLFLCISIISCEKSKTETSGNDTPCGIYKSGQQLYKGPQGECYYISNGSKTYVEREFCTCK